MALKAPKGMPQKEFIAQPNLEPGTYPARLVQIIDFGLQPQRAFQGKDKPPANEIGLTYELVDAFMVDEDGKEIEDKPRWVSENFPLHSLEADMAKSTKRYLTFDPNKIHDGDWSVLLGHPINVTIVNNVVGDKVYDNVGNIGAMRPKDVEKCPALKNEPKMFDLDAPDLETFNKLPKWIQDKIKSNLNYEESKLQQLLGGKIDATTATTRSQKAGPTGPNPFEEEKKDENPY